MGRLNYEKKDLGPSFALAVTVMLVSSLLLVLIFGANASGWRFWIMQALYTLCIGSSAFIYAAATHTRVFVATKLNVAPRYAHVLWGCLAVTFLVACMTPINNLLLDGIEALGLKRPSVELENNLAGLLIVACILPCITEEIVFRGTVAQSLANSNNRLGALAICGALFALFHANPAQTVHQFVLGAFLTLLVFRSGSLWTSVIVHFFNNALVVALSYTALGEDAFWSFSQNTGVVVACLCVGVIGFAGCVFGYVKTTKSCGVAQVEAAADRSNGAQAGDVSAIGNAQHSFAKSNLWSVITLIVAIIICVVLWATNLFAV